MVAMKKMMLIEWLQAGKKKKQARWWCGRQGQRKNAPFASERLPDPDLRHGDVHWLLPRALPNQGLPYENEAYILDRPLVVGADAAV